MDKFAFIIHPVEIEQLHKFFPAIKWLPKILTKKILKWFPAFKVAYIPSIFSNTGREIEGYLVGCPLLPEQILKLDERFVMKKIIAAIHIAKSLDAKLVGLGAYTSTVGDHGTLLANQVDIATTSGNCYTVATVIEKCLQTLTSQDIQFSQAKATIVGATGSIGSACARILARDVCQLTLNAQNKVRLEKLACKLKRHYPALVKIERDPKRAVVDADIIITATSAPKALISINDLKTGAVACDVAIPRNIALSHSCARKDVFVFEGGLAKMPHEVNFGVDIGLPPAVVYACMAETMILTFERRFENYSLGRELSLEKIEEIRDLGHKHGFAAIGIE